MKNKKNHCTKRLLAPIFLLLIAAAFSMVGCAVPKPAPDPLAGWRPLFSNEEQIVGDAIKSDYGNYIQKLSQSEKNGLGPIFLFADETGQHAIKFQVAVNGVDWAHVIIYDRDNKRVKVIKYLYAYYQS